MSILSHLHQLFNADTCHAYIHALRWKDRPLQCPRCQSHDVGPRGTYHYRPGCKRYWCNGCKRTFNDLTNTLLHQSKRSLPPAKAGGGGGGVKSAFICPQRVPAHGRLGADAGD